MDANKYQLRGRQLAMTYYPDGFGPVLEGRGRFRLSLQQGSASYSFYDDDIRVVTVPSLGDIVSVTVSKNVDLVEAVSFLIPLVSPSASLPSAIRSFAVTHRHLIAGNGAGIDLYESTKLRGFAEFVIIALATTADAESAAAPAA